MLEDGVIAASQWRRTWRRRSITARRVEEEEMR